MSYQPQRACETTGFQTPHYTPEIDLRTDAVFVYGWSPELRARVATWRAQDYRVHLMTGAAWGHYDEYLGGQFDGRTHYDEAQVARNGERIDHGNAIFYAVTIRDVLRLPLLPGDRAAYERDVAPVRTKVDAATWHLCMV